MPVAIIIRGPAGSGKSTVAAQLQKKIPKSVHIDIDKIKGMISPESTPVRTRIAHDVASHFLKQLIKEKFNIIVEEIFYEEYYLKTCRELKRARYKIVRVHLNAPLNTLIYRDAHREKNKGKAIIAKLNREIVPLDEDLIIDTSKHSAAYAADRIISKVP